MPLTALLNHGLQVQASSRQVTLRHLSAYFCTTQSNMSVSKFSSFPHVCMPNQEKIALHKTMQATLDQREQHTALGWQL